MKALESKNLRIVFLLILLFALSSCATHEGFDKNPDGTIEPYGFFSGLWHGLIFPIVLAVYVLAVGVSVVIYIGTSIYMIAHGQHMPDYFNLGSIVNFVGDPTTGLGYFLGYLLGLSQSLGGSGGAVQSRF